MTDTPLDFGDPEDLERLRNDFRAWLAGHPLPERPADEPLPVFLHRWHRQLHSGGWVGLDVPEQYGGRGLTALHQVTVSDELGARGAPGVPRIGYLAHALLRFGSEEQRRRLLPRMLSGDDVWCQGFSEPGAGSDLAGMSTYAERRPEGHYIVNGQKLWTSYAQYSGLCLLLARTDRAAPAHASISAFVLPLDRPGVTVRPLRAANGDDEFCELFLDDVRLEESERIGAEGDGWPLAMTTVAYERNALDTGHLSKYGLLIERLRRAAHERRKLPDGLLSDIGRCAVDYQVLVAHARRRTAERLAGQSAGPESSVDKLLMTRAEQRLYETALKVFPEELYGEGGEVLGDYFYSRAASVYGGTSQIQRNIIAKRLLGLPVGPRA
ncbi:acyl-CoA dehydrogenase [Streptomyces sp. P3]|uniref:acyl-CoA dehydrogenase family protein n=1 Tax=Streptomyces sp. P3 TaxID=2135430 RepID=UPI000D1A340F|nr:acyl-CoA dehydrogenase family protein [Streptomyces sp. P3]AVV46006.1 acyl-CoA dehydrogenase [Streptomyces sp. P3]